MDECKAKSVSCHLAPAFRCKLNERDKRKMCSFVLYVPTCVPQTWISFPLSTCLHVCLCVCVTCLLRSSFDACCPHMCSLYTAQCSGWSRSERVVPAVVLSAAERPAPSRPCLPSSTPRSSWRSDGRPRGWSRARSVSLACRKRSSVNMAAFWPSLTKQNKTKK